MNGVGSLGLLEAHIWQLKTAGATGRGKLWESSQEGAPQPSQPPLIKGH